MNPLDNDTDHDGILDGVEFNACLAFGGDGRPDVNDTDSGILTDFSEFMNGSDPGVLDTDGDGITDPQEIERKSNITGIEGTPPQISNVKIQVGIDWDSWGILWLPLRSHVTVSFDVSDNVGLDTVTVKFIRYTGIETRQLQFSNDPASYTTSTHVEMRFDFSIFEALVAGGDVNITAYDVNGNGAWGDFHIKSVLEAVVDAIAAFLSAIAKVIVEALSFLINFILDLAEAIINAALRPLVDLLLQVGHEIAKPFLEAAEHKASRGDAETSPEDEDPMARVAAAFAQAAFLASIALVLAVILVVLVALQITTLPFNALLASLDYIFIAIVAIVVIIFVGGVVIDLLSNPQTPGPQAEALKLDSSFLTDVGLALADITLIAARKVFGKMAAKKANHIVFRGLNLDFIEWLALLLVWESCQIIKGILRLSSNLMATIFGIVSDMFAWIAAAALIVVGGPTAEANDQKLRSVVPLIYLVKKVSEILALTLPAVNLFSGFVELARYRT